MLSAQNVGHFVIAVNLFLVCCDFYQYFFIQYSEWWMPTHHLRTDA